MWQCERRQMVLKEALAAGHLVCDDHSPENPAVICEIGCGSGVILHDI